MLFQHLSKIWTNKFEYETDNNSAVTSLCCLHYLPLGFSVSNPVLSITNPSILQSQSHSSSQIPPSIPSLKPIPLFPVSNLIPSLNQIPLNQSPQTKSLYSQSRPNPLFPVSNPSLYSQSKPNPSIPSLKPIPLFLKSQF